MLRRNTFAQLIGVTIPEDMQPGTGAWDGILWGYLYQGFLPWTRANLFVTTSYRFTGTNDREYRFGNEFTSTVGTSYRTDLFFDLSLQFRYRATQRDQRFGSEITNTGGRWLSAIPGLNLKLIDFFSVRFSTELPVYRNLQGTQLTTSNKLAVSFFYNLINSKF